MRKNLEYDLNRKMVEENTRPFMEEVMDVMEKEGLVENAHIVGSYLLQELSKLKGIKEVRGRGLMIGMEFEEPIKELRLNLLKEQHVFTGVSGTKVIRLLPPLCLSKAEADLFLERFTNIVKQ